MSSQFKHGNNATCPPHTECIAQRQLHSIEHRGDGSRAVRRTSSLSVQLTGKSLAGKRQSGNLILSRKIRNYLVPVAQVQVLIRKLAC